MSSSLFQNHQSQPNNQTQLLQLVNDIQRQGPEALFQQLYTTNPKFKQFVNDTKGMSLEDIARKYNISL